MPTRPGRGQGERVREVTRARLLATAEQMFLAQGFTATTVDAIAHEAGYTTGAVYSNFGGKTDLFLAVIEREAAAELAAVRAALDAARTDEQRLEVFTATIVSERARWQARVGATLEFLSYARSHPELHERMRAAQQLTDEAAGELVAAVCTALGLEPPDVPHELARDVLSLVSGLALRSLFDHELDVAKAMSRAVNALLTGNRSELRIPEESRRAAR